MLDLALDNRVFIFSKMDEAIQELDILFSTDIGEVIGKVNYGANWQQFLHSLTPMESSLRQYVISLLSNTYYCRLMRYDVKVQYIPGEVTSSYLVQISLTDLTEPQDSPNYQKNKTYHVN